MQRLVNKILNINVWFLFSLVIAGAVALSVLLALVLNALFYDGTNNLLVPGAFVIPLIDAPIVIILLIIMIRELRDSRQKLDRRVKELKESQDQLVRSEKLSAMGQLSAGLAHELNSPLAGLLPLLQKHKQAAETGSEAYADLTLMFRASEHMAKIVRDFGSFASKPVEERSEFSIEDVIESTLSFSSGQLAKERIELIKKYNSGFPKIFANKTELQQVVLNIITNARDAMPGRGTFIIETGMSGDKVKAEFTDSGVGISKENIGRVFDPFFTTKPQGKGIGLGLSISYGIIKNHGGEMTVESENEKWTKFSILLPAQMNK